MVDRNEILDQITEPNEIKVPQASQDEQVADGIDFDINEFERDLREQQKRESKATPEEIQAADRAKELDEDDNELSLFADIGLQAVGSVRDAANAIKDLPIDIGSFAAQTVTFSEEGDERIEQRADSFKEFSNLPEVAESERTALKFQRGVGQFLVPFAALSKLKLAKNVTAGAASTAAIRGVATDFAAFDESEDRAAKMVKELGNNSFTDNFLTDYFAGDEDDSAMESRLKIALEGAALGIAFDGTFRALKATKRMATGKRVAKKAAGRTVQKTKKIKAAKNKIERLIKSDKIDDLRPNKETISIDAQRELARGLGVSLDDVKSGKAFEQIKTEGLRNRINAITLSQEQAFTDLLDSATDQFTRVQNGDTAALSEFTDQLKEVLEIDGSVKDAIQDVARTQGFRGNNEAVVAVNDIVDIIQSGTLKDRKKFLEAFSEAKNPAELRGLIENMRKFGATIRPGESSLNELVDKWFMNSILSSPTTLVADTVSNVTFTAWAKGVEKPLAAGIGGLRRVANVGDVSDTVRLRESQVFLRQLVDDSMESVRIMKRGFDQGGLRGVRQATGEALDQARIDEVTRFGRKRQQPGLFNQTAVNNIKNPVLRSTASVLNQTATFPTSFMQTKDDLVKGLFYRSGVRERAVRNALNEGLEWGTDAFEERVQRLSQVPEDDILKQLDSDTQIQTGIQNDARQEAAELAFTNEPGEFIKSVEEAIDALPGARLFVPFIRTVNNLSTRAVERTPFRLAAPKAWKRMTAGGAEGDEELARMIAGTGMMMAAYKFASSGYITGEGPRDKASRDALLQTGWLPNSILVDGEYIDYSRSLGPLSIPLSITANLREIYSHADNNVDKDIETDIEDLIAMGATGVASGFLSQNWTSGLMNTFSALDRQDGEGVKRALRNIGASLVVPNVVNYVTDEMNPILQETDSLTEEIRARVGMDVRPRRDVFGDPIQRKDYLNIFTPLTPIGRKQDLREIPKWKKRIAEAGAYPSVPGRRISVNIGGVSVPNIEIDVEQHERLLEIIGKEPLIGNATVKETIKNLVESKIWEGLPNVKRVDGQGLSRRELVRKVYSEAKTIATEILVEENPDLIQRAARFGIKERTENDVPSVEKAIIERSLEVE